MEDNAEVVVVDAESKVEGEVEDEATEEKVEKGKEKEKNKPGAKRKNSFSFVFECL